MDDSIDTDPPASPQSGGESEASSSTLGGGEPVIRASGGAELVVDPRARPPSPPETPRETRLMIAALASGKLQPTPEVLEKLRLYEEEGERRDYERLAWMRARDEARARAEAAGGRGRRERTVPYGYGYDYNDGEAFQDCARISRKRARREVTSSSAAAAGRGGLGGTGGLDHLAMDKSVNQAEEFLQIDSVGLAKPVLGLGTELPDRSRFRKKQLPSVHTSGQLTRKAPEKIMHFDEGLHQDYAMVNQLEQGWLEASAGAMAGGCCQHERMMIYEQEVLQDFSEFTKLQKASFGATAGRGSWDGIGRGLDHEATDKLMRRAKEHMQVHLLEFVGRYPKWLAANRNKLSKQEYEQYEKQLELMVNLTVVYENEPQNFSKIANIMQKIQESGKLPNDIVADIFPGLHLNIAGQWFPGMLRGQGCCIL